MFACARLNWSITDHLPATVNINDIDESNSDWKYDDTSLADYYDQCVHATRVLIRIEVGANPASATFEGSLTALRDSLRAIAQRHIDAAVASGATWVAVEYVRFWDFSTVSDGGARCLLYQQACRSAAEELNVGTSGGVTYTASFYDQVWELQQRGLTEGATNTVLAAAYRLDTGHVNFAGMNKLGEVEWTTISPSVGARSRASFRGTSTGGKRSWWVR